ncbi:MAG: LLM class flavin-dependent oxidoreductase [Acidobacteriota bacterium]|nr:LLM class flavin-dependent oxidoreductase [Acidobacteriota bacterium]MDE3189650.1 LLM class flavin-dependent oxidoreductase [Acidobacteriota bacterium]
MSHEVGLGLQSDKTPDEYERIARRAEAAGVDVVSVFHDLFYQPAIFPLLTIARVTERVRLGPAALNPQTLHPVEIAGQVASLDLASGGRAYCGMVVGSWLDRLGLDERRPLTRLREAVEVVRRLLAGERDGFAGEIFTLEPEAALAYAPLRREVPLSIGTWRPRAAAFARDVAAEVKIGGSANPEMVRLMRSWLGEHGPRIVVGAVTVVDEDGALARAHARAKVQMYLDVVGGLDPTLELGAGETPPLEKFVIAGTPEEVAEHALALYEAGVARLEFGDPAGLDLLCDRVLPLLRR